MSCFELKIPKTPILYKQYSNIGIGNNRIYAVLLCMKSLIKNDNHWRSFVDTLDLLIEKYDGVNINSMGFPANWENY